MIYTTYFAKLKELPPDIVPVAICAKPPVWYSGLCYKKLAPKYGFFMEYKKMAENGDPNAETYYNEHFQKEVIAPLDVGNVINDLFSLSKGRDFAMVCFEKDGDFCHRKLVADWFCKEGYHVEEWNKDIHLNKEDEERNF